MSKDLATEMEAKCCVNFHKHTLKGRARLFVFARFLWSTWNLDLITGDVETI